MGRKPKRKKGNINNLFLVCNVGSQNSAIFCSVCMEKRKERVSYQYRETQHGYNDFSSLLSGVLFFGGGEAGKE